MADGMSKLRLDKYLADMGVGTRQEVKALIRKGRVAVDGITAKAPELKVDPDEAQVTVDGNSISYVKMEYWMLHKPAGGVSATEDRRDRTVLDLLSDAARKDGSDRGVLYAAGMIAGEGIVGILLAVLAVFGVADKINLSSVYGAAFQSVGNWVGLAAFVVLLAILFYFTRNKKTIEVDAK